MEMVFWSVAAGSEWVSLVSPYYGEFLQVGGEREDKGLKLCRHGTRLLSKSKELMRQYFQCFALDPPFWNLKAKSQNSIAYVENCSTPLIVFHYFYSVFSDRCKTWKYLSLMAMNETQNGSSYGQTKKYWLQLDCIHFLYFITNHAKC